MKLIIAGSRTLKPSFQFIKDSIRMLNINNITEIVCGGAKGVDSEGQHFASHMNLPVKMFRADWDKNGKVAGPMRNKQMAEYGDLLLLIWDGESKGSKNMQLEIQKLKKPVYEVILKNNNEW